MNVTNVSCAETKPFDLFQELIGMIVLSSHYSSCIKWRHLFNAQWRVAKTTGVFRRICRQEREEEVGAPVSCWTEHDWEKQRQSWKKRSVGHTHVSRSVFNIGHTHNVQTGDFVLTGLDEYSDACVFGVFRRNSTTFYCECDVGFTGSRCEHGKLKYCTRFSKRHTLNSFKSFTVLVNVVA